MGKFDGCLLYSDIDGTFINDKENIPEQNISAVKYFMNEGGKFGLATGRANHSSRRYVEGAGINVPGIFYNGAMVYDFDMGKTLNLEMPSDESKKYIDFVFDIYPDIGIEFVYDNMILACNINDEIRYHFTLEDFIFKETTLDKVRPDWIKILFVDTSDVIADLNDIMSSKNFSDAGFVRSCPYFLEMLPKNASKGNALKWTANYLGIGMDKTFAIGDFYNDLSMVKNAALGGFVKNAPEDLHSEGDVVLCSNNDGAVAEFIGEIEKYIARN